jgi:hypothetical protein
MQVDLTQTLEDQSGDRPYQLPSLPHSTLKLCQCPAADVLVQHKAENVSMAIAPHLIQRISTQRQPTG